MDEAELDAVASGANRYDKFDEYCGDSGAVRILWSLDYPYVPHEGGGAVQAAHLVLVRTIGRYRCAVREILAFAH